MFAIQISRNVVQSAACMLLAAIIVTAGLSLGALEVQSAGPHESYSVTVTQLS